MTVLSSGISMYAMGLLLKLLLGWSFNTSVWASALIVLAYILLGGLTSAIYNEVLQFFLIVAGFLPLVFLGLRDLGGWSGLKAALVPVAQSQGYAPTAWTSAWSHLASPSANPMGVEWFGLVMGLGFVLSFGYWCTDFLVVQRALAAHSMSAARRAPLISLPEDAVPGSGHSAGDDRDCTHLSTRARAARSAASRRRQLQLRHGHSDDARQLLPERTAGIGDYGAAGELHVGNGWERHRLQHRLDLRHLPVVSESGRR
jgi:hypothetical protein